MFIFRVRTTIKAKYCSETSENAVDLEEGVCLISWLLAATLNFTSSEASLEPNEGIELVLWLTVAAVSLIPVIIFSISYLRVKSTKLLITTLAFCLFFIKALILAGKLFIPNYVDEFWWAVAAILDIMIISLIAYSLSKKA